MSFGGGGFIFVFSFNFLKLFIAECCIRLEVHVKRGFVEHTGKQIGCLAFSSIVSEGSFNEVNLLKTAAGRRIRFQLRVFVGAALLY